MYFDIKIEKNWKRDDPRDKKAEIEKLERREVVKDGFDDGEGRPPDDGVGGESKIDKFSFGGH